MSFRAVVAVFDPSHDFGDLSFLLLRGLVDVSLANTRLRRTTARDAGSAKASDMHGSRRRSCTIVLVAKKQAKRRWWVRRVTTDSTHPPAGTFNKSAAEIARTMARKDVSPKGLGSGIRMIQYFINRGGRKLSPSRRAELERAKQLLQQRARRQRATRLSRGTTKSPAARTRPTKKRRATTRVR